MLNVSGAFGDQLQTQLGGISTNGKITINKFEDGDFLVLACDGCTDEVSPNKMAGILEREGTQAAKELVRHSIEDEGSSDNVSVIVLQCKAKDG